jgi:LacI family transcriptional regulator
VEALVLKPPTVHDVAAEAGVSLKTASRVVGDVINPIADPCCAAVTSAEATAPEAGLNVVFGSTGDDAGRESRQVERMAVRQARGRILAPVQGEHTYLTRYRHSLPVVVIDRAPETDGFDTVLVDDYNATGQAVQHPLRHGHRRIALVGADPPLRHHDRALRWYHDALDRAGVPRDRDLVTP